MQEQQEQEMSSMGGDVPATLASAASEEPAADATMQTDQAGNATSAPPAAAEPPEPQQQQQPVDLLQAYADLPTIEEAMVEYQMDQKEEMPWNEFQKIARRFRDYYKGLTWASGDAKRISELRVSVQILVKERKERKAVPSGV